MNRFLPLQTLVRAKIILSFLLLVSCEMINASSYSQNDDKCDKLNIPHSLSGFDIVFQIEQTVTNFSGGYPYKGAVVKHYKKEGKFTVQGTGTMQGQTPSNQQAFFGTYKYLRTGANTAVEKLINISANHTSSTIKYTFETSTSGKWEEDFGREQLKLSGSFTLEPTNLPEEQHLAPSIKADTNAALIIKTTKSDLPPNAYPTAGLVLQTYAEDGTLVFKGFGPGTVNSTGTYKYTKISAHTAVEEVTQVSEFFTFPYTMVYTFETPSSGKWFQNFGDGLILFSGTFDVFSNK